MNADSTNDSSALRPLQVVMLFLVAVTVGGGSLLLSAPESLTPVDGAIEWQVESPLRAVVQLLCLNYAYPTVNAGEIKVAILGAGASLALLVLGIGLALKPRVEQSRSVDEGFDGEWDASSLVTVGSSRQGQLAPLVAAQVLVGLYLLWSFASGRWSAAPGLAVGGSVLLTIQFLWAFGIGNGLSPRAGKIASHLVIAVAAVTSVVALWYFYGRNPTLRAKFPFGNPNFLSTCLIPGILLACTLTYDRATRFKRTRCGRSAVLAAMGLAILLVCVWAFFLTDSRGPGLGVAVGILAVIFFTLRGRYRMVPIALVLGTLLFVWVYYSSIKDNPSLTGRNTTIRFRAYAWDYAWQMFEEKPLTGHGQGGFVLAGDSHAINDVLDDPQVFEARIAHAHSEWLEVLADLGVVGFVLLAGALVLTLRGGMLALESERPPAERWALIGLMGALVGLTAEESLGVGLRVSGVPTLYYTVIGLIWALAGGCSEALAKCVRATTGRRVCAGVIGVTVGVVVFAVSKFDFEAARRAYSVEEYLRAGQYDKAIDSATLAGSRLNPQRALTSLYRLAEAHMRVARKLQERALDREIRARDSDLPDVYLLALAQQDRALSDAHCAEGSRALKKLVERSPFYINHGRVEYWLNLIQADNAAARSDPLEREFLANAKAAIERELPRQPFNPSIALDYVSVAGEALTLEEKIDVLARPLRHHGLTASYADILADQAVDPDFHDTFESIISQVDEAMSAPRAMGDEHGLPEIWGPEKLRLAATIRFGLGDYHGARDALERAAEAYDALASSASLGAASCYAELADCQFFSDPEYPAPALSSASRALTLAPDSLPGRRLKDSISQRMIDYHLAAGEEDKAERLLAASLAPGLAEDILRAELGVRYRRLCGSLLRRRSAYILRQSPNDLLPKLRRWVRRAIELNQADYLAHYLAADLAFHVGECEEPAKHLRHALDTGLLPVEARRFLEVAREKRPECAALNALWDLLEFAVPSASAQPPR